MFWSRGCGLKDYSSSDDHGRFNLMLHRIFHFHMSLIVLRSPRIMVRDNAWLCLDVKG